MTNGSYDIVILGGGMAGVSMALSLSRLTTNKPLRIALFEKNAFEQSHQSSFDDRCIALSAGSKEIYQSMGVWKDLLKNDAVEAIKNIHISEQGKLGFSHLSSEQENVEALGYVVESHALGKELIKQLKKTSFDIFCPAQIDTINFSDEGVSVSYHYKDKQLCLTSSLIIAADGGDSYCHQFLSTAPSSKSYQQSAIICNIETQYPHQGEAFERFTISGPLAVLPLCVQADCQHRCSLVWTVNDQDLDGIMALSNKDFIAKLQQYFGYRLGSIKRIGQRFSYPLILKKLDSNAVTELQRLVFIGNSAHAIHPVSGQGFNLGLRDIDTLSQLIEKNIQHNHGQFIYQNELISHYWHNREKDIKQISTFTDSLIRLFSNSTFPLTPVRNIGLCLFELCQPLKSLVARFAMGR